MLPGSSSSTLASYESTPAKHADHPQAQGPLAATAAAGGGRRGGGRYSAAGHRPLVAAGPHPWPGH